jgi:hypothetical protein
MDSGNPRIGQRHFQCEERKDMLIRLGVVALAALVVGCGGSGGGYGTGPTPPPPPANTVDATPAEAFTPASITVTAGTTVSFAFGSLGHNVFFDAVAGAPADIAGTNANTTITRVFNTAGTFTYTCHIHPNMHGTVVVN